MQLQVGITLLLIKLILCSAICSLSSAGIRDLSALWSDGGAGGVPTRLRPMGLGFRNPQTCCCRKEETVTLVMLHSWSLVVAWARFDSQS